MSRILKRPMFRKGGSSNKGIMTGLVDRKQYQFGSIDKEQIAKNVGVLEEVLRDYTPKTRLPIGEFGLNLASGMTLTDALRDPYKKFTRADDAREAAIKGGAAKLGIGQALKTPKDTRTTVIKNAMAIGLVPGTPEFNKYVQAATIKGGGLNIEFNPDGTVKAITEGNQQGSAKTQERARDLDIQTFKMNNAASNLFGNLKGAKTGPVGSFIKALDSTGAQLKMAADSFGFSTTGKNKTYDDTGSGDIDKFIQKKFGTFIGDDAAKFGRIKSASINLAYLMARIDEPGGRFTDRDIALKMEELGIGADPERTMNIMANAIKLRNENANYEYELLTGGKSLDFSKMNVIGSAPKKSTKKKTFFRPGPDGVYREYETEKD
jgi:hypothetical protein